LEQTLNICNIPIYFCNIHMKHLQHNSKTSKTLENIRLQHVLSANPGRRVGRWGTVRRDPALGRGGERRMEP
jgi:hypothetical protein